MVFLVPTVRCSMGSVVLIGGTVKGEIRVSGRGHGRTVLVDSTEVSIRLSRVSQSSARAKAGGRTVRVDSPQATGSVVLLDTTSVAGSGLGCFILFWRLACFCCDLIW